ncbi:glycosyl transferase [Fischerella major NIES-592]|uniref:Glycosyl transferase n=1 Tax=Fischerella major NIES-592 TaxID=210994 RepID=A0A1U7GV01_9CYAN|nr:glycosyltransferase family 2 protein [Fischerella major]OKH11927.1 glycosyl transferase [Fischerella major NIES-592]
MLVSVIISNYNYARYLSAAIESVLAQTYTNFEIIVVDDGSQDNSRDVINQYEQRSPHQVKGIFQENQGQGAAFNTGFAAARGEIIAFLDADDVWKPNKLQRIVEAFQDSNTVGVMHQLESIDAQDKLLDTNYTRGRVPNIELAKLILDTGNAWFYPPTSALAYRRSALTKVMPIDTKTWRLWADGCLVYCTAFLGKIQYLKEVLGSYRLHGKNYHASQQNPVLTSEEQASWQAAMETTNQGVNAFLERINYPARVDLMRNLDYRRSLYYWRGKWSTQEMLAISGIIIRYPFYTPTERVYFLFRFLLKSMGFLMRPQSQLENLSA